ncbi:MAG: rod shape-determining protein [Flavobacteriaceae bacterium]|nr:rod shape-determining protein [Flavobacteriaceae bacterium]
MKVKKYAAIDIGSNAVRLLICNIIEQKGKPTVFSKNAIIRVPIRLGADSFVFGEIGEENQQRMIDAMHAYKLLMKVHGVSQYLAYATSALREANNGHQFVDRVQKATGMNIEIIDGQREAEIIASTDLYSVLKPNKNYLFVDVGGGSTELTVYSKGEILISKSFKLGTVRLLKKMVSKQVWDDYQSWIETHTNGLNNFSILGSGGTINTLFKLSGHKLGKPLSLGYVEKQYNTLKKMSRKKMMTRLKLNPDRADVIVQATHIYLLAMQHANASKIHVPKVGLADGMVKYMYKKMG